MTPFVQQYLGGRTPIPCVSCNQDVKFGFLLERARALGGKLATGHYARVSEEGGRYQLERGLDPAKDQSYFLFTLGQSELKDIVFPIGGMTKAEVRAVAERHGLVTSQKPESMEICFVPDGDYARFVEKVGGKPEKGSIVDQDGAVLGEHDGVHKFTIGQRKGLRLPVAEPRYVTAIDADSKQVTVGPVEQTERRGFALLRPSWVMGSPPEQEVRVKIRHRHPGAPARVVNRNQLLQVELLEPARAVTPGQAAVFYDGDRVLGGGWIA